MSYIISQQTSWALSPLLVTAGTAVFHTSQHVESNELSDIDFTRNCDEDVTLTSLSARAYVFVFFLSLIFHPTLKCFIFKKEKQVKAQMI